MILAPSDTSIAQAVQALQRGELLGLPTETVYGLAADADNDAAVGRIFTAKGRPSDHPLIVHVGQPADAPAYAAQWPEYAQRLAEHFWPGPLTLIVPRRPGRAEAAAAGLPTVGLRCPSHPVARAVLAAAARAGILGLAAPSANRFGRVSPTTAAHVAAEFGDALLVLDGGACAVGIESAIVDASRGQPVLLRPGALSRAELEHVAGQPFADPQALALPAPRASGTLEAHYAPQATVRLMDAKALQAALDVLAAALAEPGARANHAAVPRQATIAVYARSPLQLRADAVLLRRMPDDPAAAAQQLFAALRSFDDAAVRLIWVETPPALPAWEGVADRLRRAAASA